MSVPTDEALRVLAHHVGERLRQGRDHLVTAESCTGGWIAKCVTDIEDLVPARQANISQHLAVLRFARLVDNAQDGPLRCYYLARPKLVRDVLAILERDDPAVKRTAAQIKREKERRARGPARRSAGRERKVRA